jgi:hypothetical protein
MAVLLLELNVDAAETGMWPRYYSKIATRSEVEFKL